MNIKDSFKLIISDRSYFISLIVMVLVAISILIMGAINIRVSELQIPVRYSSFGITNFYRDRWYYLLAFILFSLIVAATHALVSLKLYQAKGRELAMAFVWLSVIVLIISSIFIFAVFRVVSLSQ